jgi:hypothetical protein
MLRIDRVAESPRGTKFMVGTPPPEADGRQCWPSNTEREYEYYLERSGNRSVLTVQKRADYRRWLKTPDGPAQGETPEERQADRNTRTQALRGFELQDNQVYRKSEIVKGYTLPPRYAVCVWDSFAIICRIHRAMKYFGKRARASTPFFTLLTIFTYLGISKTYERIHEW